MKRLAAGLLAIFGILLATASAARAADTRCVGELSDVAVTGDLVVPDGASCTLYDVTVRGNVRVGSDAALRVFHGVAILGDVQSDHCDYASFEPSSAAARISVVGNVEIHHCRETSGKIFTAGRVVISGNFACHDNSAPCFGVALTIGGNAQVDRNSGGISYLEGNTVSGDLQCVGNTGVADYGSPNTVAGQKLGECAGLSN